jgi:predicted HAD superfamily Cof-like phosphohydrolase
MLLKAQQAVHEFHKVFNLPISDTPKELERERIELRAKWMKEEIAELLEAGDVVDQVDAVIDIIYFAIGVFVEMGIDGSKAFELVHHANMKKLAQDGKPIYNEEGKVIKPDGWVSPKEVIHQWLDDLLKGDGSPETTL